jgi:hypothetical protein
LVIVIDYSHIFGDCKERNCGRNGRKNGRNGMKDSRISKKYQKLEKGRIKRKMIKKITRQRIE